MGWRIDVGRASARLLEGRAGGRIALVAFAPAALAALGAVFPDAIRLSLGPRLPPPGTAHGARGAVQALPLRAASFDAAVAWLVGTKLTAPARRALLAEIRCALRPAGTLLVVDHNRPRTWWKRLASVGWCLARRVDPWRRPAYPVAREIGAADFVVDSLRLAHRERLQLVCARPAAAAPSTAELMR